MPLEGNSSLLVVGDSNFISQEFSELKAHLFQLTSLFRSLKPKEDDPLLTEEHLAAKLGVCEKTIKNRLKNREMDYIEIKGKRYVRQSEFNRYLNTYLIPRKKKAA